MTTCASIVRDAYGELNITALGKEPSGAMAEEGMRRLNRLLDGLAGMAIGEKLRDYKVVTDKTLPANSRAVVTGLVGSITLTLPPYPDNGARVQIVDAENAFGTYAVDIDRNGRLLEGSTATLTASTNGFSRTWMYRADLADWRRVTSLALTDTFPYPADTEDTFILMLALRLCGRFTGVSLSAEQQAALTRGLSSLRSRYRQRVITPIDPAFLEMSRQTYDNGSPPVAMGGIPDVGGDVNFIDDYEEGLEG